MMTKSSLLQSITRIYKHTDPIYKAVALRCLTLKGLAAFGSFILKTTNEIATIPYAITVPNELASTNHI